VKVSLSLGFFVSKFHVSKRPENYKTKSSSLTATTTSKDAFCHARWCRRDGISKIQLELKF